MEFWGLWELWERWQERGLARQRYQLHSDFICFFKYISLRTVDTADEARRTRRHIFLLRPGCLTVLLFCHYGYQSVSPVPTPMVKRRVRRFFAPSPLLLHEAEELQRRASPSIALRHGAVVHWLVDWPYEHKRHNRRQFFGRRVQKYGLPSCNSSSPSSTSTGSSPKNANAHQENLRAAFYHSHI